MIAKSGGYFWLPCPLCSEHFGGHEWTTSDKLSSIKKDENSGIGICPDCTEKGLGTF